jgi:pyrimidine-specific ribonucleoside hydrolase
VSGPPVVHAATPIIIDADPGIDDAIAILLALASSEVDVQAVTTVAGNTSLANATDNALRILAFARRGDIPVAAGAARPLVHAHPGDAASVHGATGLGGCGLPAPSGPAVAEHAVDLIARIVRDQPGRVVLVATGPLTNVALFVARYPDTARLVRRLVIMGGSQAEGGNVTPAAEFNTWYDPEAAVRVLATGIPTRMVSLDVTHQARLERSDIERLRRLRVIGPPVSAMLDFYAARHAEWYGDARVAMHDSLAVAAEIDATLLVFGQYPIVVDTTVGPARGATLIDRWGVTGERSTTGWATSVDRDRFVTLLCDRLEQLDAALTRTGAA